MIGNNKLMWFKLMDEFEWDSFHRCFDLIENSLKGEVKRFNDRVAEAQRAPDSDGTGPGLDMYAEEWDELSLDFPNTFRASMFVTLYSHLEHALDVLCKVVHHEMNLTQAPAPRNNGLFRSKSYLKKAAGIAFPDTTAAWNAVVHYNKIRNQIVHSGSRLPAGDSRKAIEKFVAQTPTLSITPEPDRRIVLLAGSLEQVFDNVRHVLHDVRNVIGL